jgi:hypothetical protein
MVNFFFWKIIKTHIFFKKIIITKSNIFAISRNLFCFLRPFFRVWPTARYKEMTRETRAAQLDLSLYSFVSLPVKTTFRLSNYVRYPKHSLLARIAFKQTWRFLKCWIGRSPSSHPFHPHPPSKDTPTPLTHPSPPPFNSYSP